MRDLIGPKIRPEVGRPDFGRAAPDLVSVTDRPVLLLYTALSAAMLLGLLHAQYVKPVAYVYLAIEDSWCEYGSFVAWAAAACLYACALVRRPRQRSATLYLVTAAALFVALEEISWGQRIFDLPVPAMMLEHNLQGEVNLHNLGKFQNNVVIGIAVLLGAIGWPLALDRSGWLRRRNVALRIPVVPRSLWPLFGLAAGFFISRLLVKNSEMAEAALGLGNAALGLALLLGGEVARRRWTVAARHAALVVVIAAATALLVHAGRDDARLARELHKFAVQFYPSAGLTWQALRVFEYAEEHPKLVTAETRIEHGRLLRLLRHPVEARAIWRASLAADARRAAAAPDDPEPHRTSGVAFRLLGRPDEARRSLQRALEVDELRLARTSGAGGQGSVRFSIARTLFASNDTAGALRTAAEARALAPERRQQAAIDRWVASNQPRGPITR